MFVGNFTLLGTDWPVCLYCWFISV